MSNDTLMSEIQRTLGRLESSIDALTAEVRLANATHAQDIKKLEERVEALERWRMWIVGGALGIAGTIGTLGIFVFRLLSLFKQP